MARGQHADHGARARMRSGSAPRCSTARGPSRAWRPTSICIARASTPRPPPCFSSPAFRPRHGRPDPRGHEEVSRRHHALRPPDVLGRAAGPHGVPPDPEFDAVCAHALRRADAPAGGLLDHAVAVPPAEQDSAPVDAKAGCLYPNNARAHVRGEFARLRQLRRARPRRQCRRARQFQCVHGQGRRRVHADAERHVSRRHHPPARDQAAARRRHNGGGNSDALCRFRNRRRDFLVRQLFQGDADQPHRRARIAARPALPQGARALLGLCAFGSP